MNRLARRALGLAVLVAFIVTIGLCGCKGKSKLEPSPPPRGPGATKTPEQKKAYMEEVKQGRQPPPGPGGPGGE